MKAERRAVDRDLRPEEAETAFEERTIEMTETSEEAEIEKQARVVGEVSLTKTAKEREQTVREAGTRGPAISGRSSRPQGACEDLELRDLVYAAQRAVGSLGPHLLCGAFGSKCVSPPALARNICPKLTEGRD